MPAAVPPPPAHCGRRQLGRAASDCAVPRGDVRAALDRALDHEVERERDAALAALEPCEGLPAGLILALRADLAPVECGDALVASALLGDSTEPAGDVRETLIGLGLAARLARLARDPPTLAPPYDKATFDRFMKSTLMHWIASEAKAIHAVAAAGARLHGYAKGIVAVEAGMADMRFVRLARSIPLPQEMAGDREIEDVYFASLDRALDRWKVRGRDGALVGLRMFAETGILDDPRLQRARTLLSKVYAGRRIDSLDGLLLPPMPTAIPSSLEARLASRLPTFYAGKILTTADPNDAVLLRALYERGLPGPLRAALESSPPAGPARRVLARILVRFSQVYWRVSDLDAAARIAAAPPGSPSGEARLIAALAAALHAGPRDAAAMILQGPMLPDRVGDVSALDALARSPESIAALARFDAAYLLALVPKTGRDAAFWQDVADRFRRAGRELTDDRMRATAERRARDASAIARSLENAPASRP